MMKQKYKNMQKVKSSPGSIPSCPDCGSVMVADFADSDVGLIVRCVGCKKQAIYDGETS